MTKLNVFIVAAVGLVASGSFALAQDTQTAPTTPSTQSAPAAQPSSGDDPNQIVCRSMAPPTGTRLGARRVCQTQREWDDQSEQAREQLEKTQSMPERVPGN